MFRTYQLPEARRRVPLRHGMVSTVSGRATGAQREREDSSGIRRTGMMTGFVPHRAAHQPIPQLAGGQMTLELSVADSFCPGDSDPSAPARCADAPDASGAPGVSSPDGSVSAAPVRGSGRTSTVHYRA